MRDWFIKYSEVYRTIFPTKSLMSYNYVIYKFNEFLEREIVKKELILKHHIDRNYPKVTMLANIEKIGLQDDKWQIICGELKWEFTPSL
jgi:hypothetical protein